MIFKCDNCGGNVVFDPEIGKMHCPHCDGIDSQKKVTGEQSMEKCINCGAPLTISDYTSATRCEHCGSYIVFDERVEGQYRPHLLVPFTISKKKAKEIMREKFKKKTFAPAGFLSDHMLEKLSGIYVPFFLYDLNVQCNYWAEGFKKRTWVSGETEYTEVSTYDVHREMEAKFDKIPVDASVAMDDSVMDLMEPYDYSAIADFKEEYMSGFDSEIFSQTSEQLSPRAKKKAESSANSMLEASLCEYSSMRVRQKDVHTTETETNYTLMPIWYCEYSYHGVKYQYYINGQTGKTVGKTPVSQAKVFAYGMTVWSLLSIIFALIKIIL